MNIRVYCAINPYLSLKRDLAEEKVGAYDRCSYEKPQDLVQHQSYWRAISTPFLFLHDV